MMIDLRCGDGADELRCLPRPADLILTSPPYGGMRDYGGHGFDFSQMAESCVDALAAGGVLVWIVADETVEGSESGESFRQALHFMEIGLRLHDTMIYQARNPAPHTAPVRYFSTWEYMFVFSLGPPRVVHLIRDRVNITRSKLQKAWTIRGRSGKVARKEKAHVVSQYGIRTNIWEYSVGGQCTAPDFSDSHDHPAIFPLALARDHIRTWTDPGDLVVDPMMGSGTTIRAAHDLGRDAVGIDIHEPYVELARRRMAQRSMDMKVEERNGAQTSAQLAGFI